MNWTTDSNGDHLILVDGHERARLPFIPLDYPTRDLTEIGLKQEVERILGVIDYRLPRGNSRGLFASAQPSRSSGQIRTRED